MMSKRLFFNLLFTFVLLCENVKGRVVPPTPCPKLFNYFESRANEIFGAMNFENDLSGRYELEVEMSMPVRTDGNIKIIRRTPDYKIQNGARIEYFVLFPNNETFPVLTSVTFNNRLRCSGPPAEGNNVTPLKAKNSVSLKVIQGSSESPPPIQVITTVTVGINDPECGVNIFFKPLVVNGESAKDGEFPWAVAIMRNERALYIFHCAATLVSKSFAVTAAHCLIPPGERRLNDNKMLLLLGSRDISAWANKATIRNVKTSYVHPEYRLPGHADIAVLEMNKPVSYSISIKPICFWNGDNGLDGVIGKSGMVAGWGKDETGRSSVEKLRKITMPIVSNEDCLRLDQRYLNITSKDTFCAGSVNANIGPCTGDSGGGFVMQLSDNKYYFRGVVSVALESELKDCDINKYVVFADVTKFTPWIKEKMDTDTNRK